MIFWSYVITKAFATNSLTKIFVWDVWFDGQIVCSKLEHLSNIDEMRNLQEQVKKAFCYQNFFWPFTVWINCFWKFSAFSFEFQKFFSITRTIFSQSRSEQFLNSTVYLVKCMTNSRPLAGPENSINLPCKRLSSLAFAFL